MVADGNMRGGKGTRVSSHSIRLGRSAIITIHGSPERGQDERLSRYSIAYLILRPLVIASAHHKHLPFLSHILVK